MTTTCDFCIELRADVPSERVAWLDDQWALIATRGPLSDCHLLLVPREHKLFSLQTPADLVRVQTLVRQWSDSFPGSAWVAFEHANAPVGCGVTHAHVHLLASRSSVAREALFEGLSRMRLGYRDSSRAPRDPSGEQAGRSVCRTW